MKNLPTGTVTFLFTDIEGSTALLQRLGDQRYAEVLEEHRRLLRDAFAAGHGQEIDTQGDAFLVAFARARDALASAVAAQRALTKHPWPDGASLRVRMGLHTGEPVSSTGDYVGLDVHRAARICAAGHGGQILLSDAVSGLTGRDLPSGVSLRDLGTYRLKDLRDPEHLFQVLHAGLPSDFPSLKSLDVRPNNLPVQLTSFIGRVREIAEIKRLLGDARLVTLTGSGGAGKTRLALQVAADVLVDYPDGVWLAELAPIADPTLVSKTVASALNVPEQPGRKIADTLVDALRHKTLLLALDNCEHLVSACRDLAVALLRSCPHVRILVTSREGLGVAGETLWRVPSLSVPEDVRHLPPPEELVLYDAVRLFADRAAATAPGFRVTSRNASAITHLCQQLDGIPLAIELAAARAKVLSVEQIAARLDDRFHLLTGGSRTVLPRHQTLGAAIDWSYNLLSEKERVLLRRLSVFAGGWTLEAAEAVCAGGVVEVASILDVLTSLVDKSLVLAETQHGEARYRLLETIRQYARHRLVEAGEDPEVRTRHRDWYMALAESAEPEMRGTNQVAWLERLERNHDNLRAALEWSEVETGTAAAGLRLATALYEFWEIHGHFAEARAWLDEMLRLDAEAPPDLRVRALNRAGHLAYRQGDHARVLALCQQALALSETAGDRRGHARALHYLAHGVEGQGNYRRATELFERSIALHRAAGSRFDLAQALHCFGNSARVQGNFGKATALFEESLAIFKEFSDKRSQATTLHNFGYLALSQGDRKRARRLFRESVVRASELGDTRVLNCLGGLAAASDATGAEWAAGLFGAVETLMSAAGVKIEPANRPLFEEELAATKRRLGERTFNAAWATGVAMTLEQAIEYALAENTD